MSIIRSIVILIVNISINLVIVIASYNNGTEIDDIISCSYIQSGIRRIRYLYISKHNIFTKK